MTDKEQIDAYKALLPDDLLEEELDSSIEFTLNRSKWLQKDDVIITNLQYGNALVVTEILENGIVVKGTGEFADKEQLIEDGTLPFYYKLSNVDGEFKG